VATTVSDSPVPDGLVMAEGFDRELEHLKAFLGAWTAASSNEVKPLLHWQFLGRSKYFRPVTLFACHSAMSETPIGEPQIRAAAAVEMVHNVSLIVDDILDRSRFRRGILTMHCRFGLLPALMTSGYITADSFELAKNNPFNTNASRNCSSVSPPPRTCSGDCGDSRWVSRTGASSPAKIRAACSKHAPASGPAMKSSGAMAPCSGCCTTAATTSAM